MREPIGVVSHPPAGDARGEVAPAALEVALRKVRLLAAALVGVHLLATPPTRSAAGVGTVAALLAGYCSLNVVSWIAQRNGGRVARGLGAVQVVAGAAVVLGVLWMQERGATSGTWAILALPLLEAAIRFRLAGVAATWCAIAAGYATWNLAHHSVLPPGELGRRLVVVLLLALPSGFLAHHLVAEIAAHRRGRTDAERRSAILRAAALGGRASTSLDVDEILDVLRGTVCRMGFADPGVFEVDVPSGSEPARARPVRYSRDVIAVPPGDERLVTAAAAVTAGRALASSPGARPPTGAHAQRPSSVLVAVPVRTGARGVVVTARWPHPDPPDTARREGLELLAAQAGAALHNAQVHRELQARQERLAHAATHDALTDLPNRRRFHDELERACGRGRPGDRIAVLFLDLDGFKAVNDRLGHEAGNDLLVAVARRLAACTRPGDLVARMGGDEFTLLLARLVDVAPAIEVAERVCATLAEPFPLPAGEARVSASVGIAVAPADVGAAGDLVRRADVAMYRAKRQGKARWALDPGSLPATGGHDPRIQPDLPAEFGV